MTTLKKIARDTFLFRDGDQPDAMYILKSGLLQVSKQKGSGEVILAEIQPGGLVGEMALFDRKPRSADVKAKKDCEVVALPYDNLQKELDGLPVWLKAVLKSLNENLREANKKIRSLESGNVGEDRFPPHVINKLLTILNLVTARYGKPNDQGLPVLSSYTLRNFTIQIFQEATNKMQSVLDVLAEMSYIQVEDKGDGTQRITHKSLNELTVFVDWYNEYIFKQEKDKNLPMNPTETNILGALIKFAEKASPDAKGFRKVNLNDVQNDSMREVGFLIKVDDVSSLIEKKYLTEKIMDTNGVFISLNLEETVPTFKHWSLIHEFKKRLR